MKGPEKPGTRNLRALPRRAQGWAENLLSRKFLLTLIALLASIFLAAYGKWSAGGTTLIFSTILGFHHIANVAQSKL